MKKLLNTLYITTQGAYLRQEGECVEGPVNGNILLRREQYRRADLPAGALAIARNMLTAKLANGRTVLQRSLRDHQESDADGQTAQAVAKLRHTLGTLATISDPVGLLLHAQALLLARHLRGDLDAYPPFIWK